MDRISGRQGFGRRLTALVVAALVAASCGASVSSKSTGTTAASRNGSTTTASTDTTAASPTTRPSSDVTSDDLEGLLPTAADIGPDYRVDTDDDSDDSDDAGFDEAMKKSCPDAAKIVDAFDDEDESDGPSADRSFTTDDERSVEVELETDESFGQSDAGDDERTLKTLVDAINACGTITGEAEGGLHYEMKLEAMMDGELGDIGIAMRMTMEMTGSVLPGPIEMKLGIRMFQVGAVFVSVTVSSGLDQDTFEAVPGDFDLLTSLPEDLEKSVSDLQGLN